jgi:phage recombination protein Bet
MTNLTCYTDQWDEPQTALIKQQIAPGCTDEELALFGLVCTKTGLDPFNRQIYAIKRNQWNAATKTSESKMTIQISIDGYRVMAARTNRHLCTEINWCGPDGQWADIWLVEVPPAAARAQVWVKGCNRPFTAVAKFNSYKQTNKEGKLTSTWEKMPDVMIAKCAESQALRMAFPGIFATAPNDNDTPGEIIEAIACETNLSLAEIKHDEHDEHDDRRIAEMRSAMVEHFEELSWSSYQKKSWAKKQDSRPSDQWPLAVWESAIGSLMSELDQKVMEL